MVLGADGPHSRVRELLLGSESAKCTTMGLVELGAIVSYGDAERARTVRSSFETFAATAVHPTGVLNFVTSKPVVPLYLPPLHFFKTSGLANAYPRRSIVQNVPSPTDPSTWSFQIFLSFDGQRDPTLDNAARLALMKSRAEVLAEPFRSAVLWIPEGTPVHLHNHSYWSSKIWANHGGRVTLAGDAAHPMPPSELPSSIQAL